MLNRSFFIRSVAALMLIAAVSCAADNPAAPHAVGNVRVLFIGNSLTYVNDLGQMLVDVARLAGDTDVVSATVAFADYALEDHLASGQAVRALQSQKWEFVVMQQGPSSLPGNQVNLANAARTFAPLIRAAGAEPVLYMVWPDISRVFAFPDVRVSYSNAAAAAGGIFAPAGDAWSIVLAREPSIALYQPDGLHATPAGTYLAAIVILSRLRGIDPSTLPKSVPRYTVSAATIAVLQSAAHDALARNPARP